MSLSLSLSLGLSRLSGGSALDFAHTDDTELVDYWNTTSGVTSSLNSVSQWDGVNGGSLVQPTGSAQPTTNTRTLGGRNVIDADGTEYLEVSGFSMPSSGNVAFLLVAAVDAGGGAFDSILSVDATVDLQLDRSSQTFKARLNGSGGIPVILPVSDNTGPSIYEIVLDFDSSQAELLVDGVSQGTGSYTTKISATQTLRVFTNRAATGFLDGAFGDLVITEGIGVLNRSNHRSLLASNFGISL